MSADLEDKSGIVCCGTEMRWGADDLPPWWSLSMRSRRGVASTQLQLGRWSGDRRCSGGDCVLRSTRSAYCVCAQSTDEWRLLWCGRRRTCCMWSSRRGYSASFHERYERGEAVLLYSLSSCCHRRVSNSPAGIFDYLCRYKSQSQSQLQWGICIAPLTELDSGAEQ